MTHSEAAADAARGTLFVVCAPSGAGKTTLVRALVRDDPFAVLSISHTTRETREGEVDGEHYFFVDEDRFVEMIGREAFFEHAEVFGARYGTSREAVEANLADGRDVILEIDWQGARQVREQMPGCVGVFILYSRNGGIYYGSYFFEVCFDEVVEAEGQKRQEGREQPEVQTVFPLDCSMQNEHDDEGDSCCHQQCPWLFKDVPHSETGFLTGYFFLCVYL